MSDENEMTESTDTVEVAETPETGAGRPERRQPIHEQAVKGAPRERQANGKYAKKVEAESIDMREIAAIARDAMQGTKKSLPKDTDAKALDAVKPQRQDPEQGQDLGQGKQPTDATEPSASKTEPSKPSQHSEKDLAKYRAALVLKGHDEDDLAVLTDDQLAALGKKAAEKNADKDRELREKAAAKKAQAQAKPSNAKDDEAESAEFEKIAREHFADFDDEDGKFTKSLSGFARAAHSRMRDELKGTFEEASQGIQSMIDGYAKDLRSMVTFEVGSRELAVEYPKSQTPEGRNALIERFSGLLKADGKLDARSALRQAADSLWAAERLRMDAERQQQLRTARQGGHSTPPSNGEAPRQTSDMDVARQAVRQFMTGAR